MLSLAVELDPEEGGEVHLFNGKQCRWESTQPGSFGSTQHYPKLDLEAV